MLTNYQNQTSFKSLYTGQTIGLQAAKTNNKSFIKEAQSMKRFLRQNNIHKKENVDVILNHDGDSFYGVISSKTQGTPMHPLYRHPVSKEPKLLEKFKNWVDSWDKMYS